jgi:outer membrane protein assembly factor BamB
MKNKITVISLICLALIPAVLNAGNQPSDKSRRATPCMKVLNRFTAKNVPAVGPDETVAPIGNWTKGITPANLPGNGLAQHPMLYVGENYNKMFIVKDGKVIWTYSTGEGYEYDDVWMLSNGNILFTRMKYIAEITPDKKIIWQYDCNEAAGPNHTEIHTCQPIGLDKVMFVVNGLPPRLMVINIKTGKVEVEHELPCSQPTDPTGIHGQFRRARVTAQGTYLVSVFGMGYVAEYDKNFKEIWRYKCKLPWSALRLKNGNTLITNEPDNLTIEVNSKGETVWEFNTKNELPEAYRFASAPQTCTRLANGNTIFTSRGDSNGNGPQLVEITPDKKVVWVLQDWKTLGPATTVQILDDPGIPEIPGDSEH